MIKLWKFQEQCKKNVMGDLQHYRKIAVVSPTGSGKTTIFGAIIKEYLERNRGKRVVVVSHLSLLISQTKGRLLKEWDIKNVGVLQGSALPRHTDQVIITTMQSFRDEDKLKKWSKKESFSGIEDLKRLNIGLIIIDETHFAGCSSYTDIIDFLPDAQVIGFTATPFRKNKLMTNIFEKVSFTISMGELVKLGHLVEPKLHLTPFNPFDLAEMYSMMVKIYKDRHKGQKALIYLRTIDEAELCRNIFVDSGVSCSAVTSMFTGDGRDDLLKDFREGGGPDVLTTVDVLTAGFDSPNVRAIFMPYKIGSITTFLQRVGRGLRTYPTKTCCDLYVGSDAPDIQAGFWEKMTRKMMAQGKQSFDNYLDMCDYGRDILSAERYKWTADVVEMAKDVKRRGLENLYDLIITKKLPESVLNIMIEKSPLGGQSRAVATMAQINALNKFGITHDKITKLEATAIITAYLDSKKKLAPDEIVPRGMHKGKHFSQVPAFYWMAVSRKAPAGELYRSYLSFKKKQKQKIQQENTYYGKNS